MRRSHGSVHGKSVANVTVTTEYTGSGAGIESVTSGAVDIGNASRALSDKEKSVGIEENIVAIDGIAMITDKNNKATNVTKQQLTRYLHR